MSWNVISNSNILRVNSFIYKKVKNDGTSMQENQENFAPQLLEYMNDIFSALDSAQTGFITVEALDKYWKSNEKGYDMFLKSHYGISSANVVKCMQQIVPDNGKFNFRKFVRGMKMAVSNAKNDRLRNISFGNLKARESIKPLTRSTISSKPPCPDSKPDRKSFGSTTNRDETKVGYHHGQKRPLQEIQKRFGFREKTEEESIKESNVFSQSLEKNATGDDKIKPSQVKPVKVKSTVRELFSNVRRRSSSTGVPFESNSFISQSDTIDYTKDANITIDSCIASVDDKTALELISNKENEEALSKRSRVSRRFDDQKYRAFRKTELDKLVDQASEMIRMMQKCMDATENAREWYTRKISSMQQERMELRRMVFLGKGKDETEAKIKTMKSNWQSLKYEDVKHNMGIIDYYTEQLLKTATGKGRGTTCESYDRTESLCEGDITSPLKSTTKLILEKMVEGQSRQIKQLENEKAALVREVFLMKGKLNIVEKPIDQVVPF